MIDAFKKQTVIDLSKRMHGDINLLASKMNIGIADMSWVNID